MGATVDTQALDLRAQGGLDGGKSRGGQGDDADAFAGLMSDLDNAKPTTQPGAVTTSPVVQVPVAAPDTTLLTLSAGTSAVTSATSMSGAASPPLPTDKGATVRPQFFLPETATVPAPAAADPSIRQASVDQASVGDTISSTASLFQVLIDGTGTKTSVKGKASQHDDDPAPVATPVADAQGALTLPALIAAAAASTPTVPTPVTTQAVVDGKGERPIKGAPAVALSMADDAALSDDTASPISDIKVETHLAVAGSHAVATDAAGPQTMTTEASDPSLSAGALAAMAPQTRSVVHAIETLLDQAPVATTPDPASPVTPAPPRTMTLQLTPPDLGTVQVRLHLSGQALDLQLSVSSKETLGAISRDRAHLETALASQNYDLRTLTIHGADGAGAATTGDPQAGGRGASEQGGTQNQGPSTSGNSAGGGNDRRQANSRGLVSDEDSRAAAAPRAGGLFV